MFSPTRMMVRAAMIGILLIVVSNGCSNQKPAPFEPESRVLSDKHEAPFNPQERYPGWAFDQPEYLQPNTPLDAEMPSRGDDPNHFFTNNCVVLIEQPSGYTPEEIPRVAVYRSDDNGFTWKRDGMFGREQQYYALETYADGDYGIRFVGPGQQLAERTPADPQRVYHVDTQPPELEIEINPEKTWYRPGDQIKIAWAARDPHLIANPVRLGMLMDFTGDVRNLVELQRDLADEGSMTYRIMPDTAGHEIVFRVEALDRADNLGLAYSHHLQIVDQDAEQIVQKRARRPHDDRLPARPQPAPQPAPVRSNPTATMETMTPISKATPTTVSEPKTIEAAKQPNTPTVISAASMTNDELAVNDGDDSVQLIMRPEREPTHKSIAIRTSEKKGDHAPAMTAVTIAPRNTAANDTEAVAAKDERKVDEAKIAADAARGEEVIASFKTAFSKMADTVATAAEEAQKEQALARADEEKESEDESTATTVVATRDESEADMTEQDRTSVKVVPVAARSDYNASASPSTSRGTAPLATPDANTLVAPMPGIVASDSNADGSSHPWRSLGSKPDSGKAPVWSLPSDKPSLRGRPTIRVVEQPTRSKKVYAGTPTEDETPID